MTSMNFEEFNSSKGYSAVPPEYAARIKQLYPEGF